MQLDRPRRRCARLALLAVAGGQQHAELGGDGDHQRAQRDRHRVELHRERPGQLGQQEQHARPTSPWPARSGSAAPRPRGGCAGTASSTRNTASQRREQRERAAQARTTARRWRPPPARAGRPPRRVTPSGGSSRSLIRSTTSFCSSSDCSRMPKARLAVLRSRRDHALREVGGDGVEQRVRSGAGCGRSPTGTGRAATAPGTAWADPSPARQVSPVAVAAVLQRGLLELRHPGDHLGAGDVVGPDGHVDLARTRRSPPGGCSRPSAPGGRAAPARGRRRRPRSGCPPPSPRSPRPAPPPAPAAGRDTA